MLSASVLSRGIKVAAAAWIVTLLAVGAPDGTLSADLEPSEEHNVFSWASTVATFAAAYASFLLALAVPEQRLRFGFLAGSFAFLSLDDAALIHERVGAKVFEEWLDFPENVSEQLELLLYLPIFAAALWIVWTVVQQSPWPAARVLLGGVSLLGLAVACEFAGTATRRLEERGLGFFNTMRVGVEEASELGGWTLVATALTALACTALAMASQTGEPARER